MYLSIIHSPAAAYGKDNVIGMNFCIALHKLDARGVLPVAHGLLEERLVQATEVAVDLVGNDTVVPDALLFGGHSTSYAMMMMSFHFPLRAAAVEDKNVDGCSCGHIECLMQQLLRANVGEWKRTGVNVKFYGAYALF